MGKPRDYAMTFGGAGTQYVLARGRFVRVLATPAADAFFSLDNGSELERGAGQQIADSDPNGFSRVDVRSTVAQTVRFTVADVPQDDSRSNVALAVTASVTPGNDIDNGGDVSCAAGVATLVMAADLTRLAALITNQVGNTTHVRVGKAGVGAASGWRIEPGESIPVATTSALYVYNPHVAAQTVNAAAVTDV